MSFEVKGAADFRAVCNGDASSLEMFHEANMKLFSGKLVVYLQSNHQAGDIVLKVKGGGLKPALLKLIAQ